MWNDPWQERRGRASVEVPGGLCEPGARVRLHPAGNADILDLALVDKTAVVHAIEEDFEGNIYLVVTVDDDPGKDLGVAGKIAHRFFFRPAEVELLTGGPS